MLIDDLREIDFRLDGAKLKDAISFLIMERGNDFLPPIGSTPGIEIPSYLPYPSITLSFTDKVIWYFQAKDEGTPGFLIHALEFRPEDMGDLLKWTDGGKKDLPFCSLFQMSGAPNEPQGLKSLGYFLHDFTSDKTTPWKDMSQELRNEIKAQFFLLQKFLRFLSCKNVKSELTNPPEKVQAKRRKKGKLPLVSFYTLKLQIPSSGGQDSPKKDLWTNRVHLCRGHMREYTADAHLFGRLVGRYWIPPHARGNKKEGLIIKDYQIDNKSGK